MAEDTDEDWFERALGSDQSADTAEESETDAEESETAPESTAESDQSEPPAESVSDAGVPESDRPETEPADAGPESAGSMAAAFSDDLDTAEAEPHADGTETGTHDETFGTGGDTLDIDVSDGETFGFDIGTEESEVDVEEYHTEIPRIDIGIQGLDAMIQEGVPERSLMAVIGGAGTGKTTFGIQFLQEALAAGDRAVYITLEETRDRIFRSASQKGWDFEAAAEAGDLAVLDLDPVDMANSLTSIRSELPRLVGDFGADRLALDSVSLLEMMYDDQATRRTEIYDFANALKRAGVTTLVTSEAAADTAYSSRFGIIEYLTDAVFVLQYVRPDEFQETRLAVEIQKIRDANHSRESKPYEITNEGIAVYRDATIF